MGEESKFRVDAAFDEGLKKRVSTYERKSERAKKAWKNNQSKRVRSAGSDYVDIPEYHIERKFDKDIGKVSFELGQTTRRIVTPHVENIKRLKRRAYYEARGTVHRKISENEQDNTGVEAAHTFEQKGEEVSADLRNMLPSGRTVTRKLQQRIEQKAQRQKAQRLKEGKGQENRLSLFQREVEEFKASKSQNMFLTEQKPAGALHTEVKNRNDVFAKELASQSAKKATKETKEEVKKAAKRKQKKKLMKQAIREAQKESAKRTAQAASVKGAATTAEVTAAGIAAASAGGKAVIASGAGEYLLYAVLIIVCIIVLAVVLLFAAFLIVTQINLHENVLGLIYQSDPDQIEAAELHYSYMEACLSEYMEDLENQEEGYDGYVIDEAAGIGHNPYTLINYLSAKYGAFTMDDVRDEIEDLFNHSYTITTWIEDITVTPEEEEESEETSEEESEEPSEEPEPETLHIFHIKLTKVSLEELVAERMDADETEMYELYTETRGGFPFVASPTGYDFMNRISSYYGYRYHPLREEIRLHRGLDIALPEGTNLYAGIDGTVTAATEDPGGYGLYITITGEDGVQVRYGHMSEFSVSEGAVVRRGDLIGKSGNTGASTGPHVHVEVLEGGNYYNPLFYLDTE